MNPWAVDGDPDYCPAGSPWAEFRHYARVSSLTGIAARCEQCNDPIVMVRSDTPDRWVWTLYVILEEEF